MDDPDPERWHCPCDVPNRAFRRHTNHPTDSPMASGDRYLRRMCRSQTACRRPVAIQTFAEAPLEARRLGFSRVERVINQTLSRIRGDEFEHLPVLNGTNSNTVIEKKG